MDRLRYIDFLENGKDLLHFLNAIDILQSRAMANHGRWAAIENSER